MIQVQTYIKNTKIFQNCAYIFAADVVRNCCFHHIIELPLNAHYLMILHAAKKKVFIDRKSVIVCIYNI